MEQQPRYKPGRRQTEQQEETPATEEGQGQHQLTATANMPASFRSLRAKEIVQDLRGAWGPVAETPGREDYTAGLARKVVLLCDMLECLVNDGTMVSRPQRHQIEHMVLRLADGSQYDSLLDSGACGLACLPLATFINSCGGSLTAPAA